MKKLNLFLMALTVAVVACDGADGGPVYNDEGICVMNCLPDAVGTDTIPDAPDALETDSTLPEAVVDNEPT